MTRIDPFTFLLYALAVYRLSLLVSKESGPMRMFAKLRKAPPAKSSLKEGLSCQLCQSLWHAIPVSAFACWREGYPNLMVGIGDWFILMLSMSAAAIIFHMHTTRNL